MVGSLVARWDQDSKDPKDPPTKHEFQEELQSGWVSCEKLRHPGYLKNTFVNKSTGETLQESPRYVARK